MARQVDFEDQAPDRIPDELLAEFQRHARRAVRRSRRRRLVTGRLTRFGSGDVWWAATFVFCGLAVVGALGGGLVYAVVAWPWIGLFVVAPAVVLFGVSLGIAAATRHRWREWSIW